jgi:hypothetical protein
MRLVKARQAWHGRVQLGGLWRGQAGRAWQIVFRRVLVRHGEAGAAGYDEVRCWYGMVWQA